VITSPLQKRLKASKNNITPPTSPTPEKKKRGRPRTNRAVSETITSPEELVPIIPRIKLTIKRRNTKAQESDLEKVLEVRDKINC